MSDIDEDEEPSAQARAEGIEQFIAVTHCPEDEAQFYLAAASGDVHRAIETYLSTRHEARPRSRGIDSGGSAARRQAPLESTAGREARLDAILNRARQHVRPQTPRAGPPPGRPPLLFRVLSLPFQAVRATLGVVHHSIDALLRLVLPMRFYARVAGAVSRLLGDTAEPDDNGGSLGLTLLGQYAGSMPAFHEGTWQEALVTARAENRPLLVYLHSPRHENTAAFCEKVLCDDVVSGLIASSFVAWAGDVRKSRPYTLATLLQASTYPYLAVLLPNSRNSQATGRGSTQVVASQAGACTAATAAEFLAAAAAAAVSMSANVARERQQTVADRDLRAEQDAALEASKAADREREAAKAAAQRAVEEAAAEERRVQEEERARQEALERAKEERAAAIVERRAAKAAALAPPPEGGDVTSLRVRLPKGAVENRKFLVRATLEEVYDWVDSMDGLDTLEYTLASTFPRKEFDRTAQAGLTLEDAGLVPNAVLMVTRLDD